MSDKIKNIFIGIIFFVVLILGTSFVIDTILIDGLLISLSKQTKNQWRIR